MSSDLVFGSTTWPRLATTAAASNVLPSAKVTPSRSRKV